MLEKELSFESDLKISVINEKEKSFGKKEDTLIGECSISLDSIMTECDRPQYFNLINEEEQFVGSILCNFLVKFYPKDMKKKNEKIDDKEEHINLWDKFTSITELLDSKINISFSVFGIRNLLFECYDPKIEVYLTNDLEKKNMKIIPIKKLEQEDEMYDEDVQNLDKFNPNFSYQIKFNEVELYKDPLMWPYIQINVVDQGSKKLVGGKKGCENTFTTISLLDYFQDGECQGILTDEEYQYAKL